MRKSTDDGKTMKNNDSHSYDIKTAIIYSLIMTILYVISEFLS